MFPHTGPPRGGRNGGRAGRGGGAAGRARKREREQSHRGVAAATATAQRFHDDREDGEVPPGTSNQPAQPHIASYAQAAAQKPNADYVPPTLHSQERNVAIPCPFHKNSHIQVTGVYSRSKAPANELLFYRFFEPGLPATREALQTLRAEVAKEVTTQFNIKLLSNPANPADDPITIVTKREADRT